MIQKRQQTTYYAPTANKTYVTKRGAANGEARAMLGKKYPTVKFETDTGYSYYWERDLPNASKTLKRLASRIFHSI